MKLHFASICISIMLATSLCNMYGASSRIYYMDSKKGNDNFSGVSINQAWKSLDRLNKETFKPGDRILFKAGTEYIGQFEPMGSGAENSPIVVDTYGEGTKPILHGRGEKQQTVLLKNIEYWEINNIEVTNLGNTDKAGRNGILVYAWDNGDTKHIHLRNITVRDVNGSNVKKDGGGNGIHWNCGGKEIPTRFIDLLIENCHIYRCQRNGITGGGNSSRDSWHPSLNVVIRGNLIEQVPGDGIVPIACDGALVEYNILRDSPDILQMQDAAAGIWPWGSDNTIIQYNEVSGQKAKWDAQGFDADYNCINTTIRYNFSHDNYGGMIMICNDGESLGKSWNVGTENTIIHSNISINDGLRPYPTRPGWFSPIIHISGPASNSVISDNIFVVIKKDIENLDRSMITIDNWGGPWPKNTLFKNNTFYIEDGEKAYKFSMGKGENTIFDGNAFYGKFINKPNDTNEKEKDKNINFLNNIIFPEGYPHFLQERVIKILESIN